MKILLVASDPDDAASVRGALIAEGHTVTSCDDDGGTPCRGVTRQDACPLDQVVDVAVVARSPLAPRRLEEMGAVCAARHRVGVVEVDPDHPLETSIYDLADEAERVICDGYSAAIADELVPVLGSRLRGVSATRDDHDVRAVVVVDEASDPIVVSGIADRTRHAVRDHDRSARVIDVVVRHGR